MERRKVIKIGNSKYINLPSEISEAMGVKEGDKLYILHVLGYGIFIPQAQGADKLPINLESIDRLKRAADTIYWQLERKLKDLDSNFISNLHASIIKDITRLGIFELKSQVEKLEKQVEESNKTKGRLTLVRKGRRNAH